MVKPKILVYDIETGPNLGYVWGKWEQNVIQFKEEWQLLSFAYKWLDDRKIIAVGGDKFGEEQLVLRMHQLLTEADIVIAHNGDKFDQRMVNAKFLEYGLTPPSPYKSIDTLKVARRYFRLNSNKLDDLGTLLGVGNKVKHEGFSLWLKCIEGDKSAWKTMLKYNKQDVVLLERVYLRLRPWITNHPNLGDLNAEDGVCPKCGSGDLEKRGFIMTRAGEKQRHKCNNCGGWCSEATIRRVGRKVNVT